jgi:hypothetical protein
MNIDEASAIRLIDHFNLKTKISREDYYINIHEAGEFKMLNHSLRVKHFLSKVGPIVQISEKSAINWSRCVLNRLKTTQKIKFDVPIPNSRFQNFKDSFTDTIKEISKKKANSKDFGYFSKAVKRLSHPNYDLIKQYYTEDSILTPVKKSFQRKYKSYFKAEGVDLKITVGQSTDLVGKNVLNKRYDIEFSTTDRSISLNDFANIACSILRSPGVPKVRQTAPQKLAENYTRELINNL